MRLCHLATGHSDASLFFKRKDKFGLTRIFPTNTECKRRHQEGSKNCTTFFPLAFKAKGDSMSRVPCGRLREGAPW